MKKILYLLVIIPLVLIVSGCSNKTYNEITYDEFNDMIDNKESFVLFIGSTTCTHCDAYKVTLNKVIEKYNVDVKYLDISKIDDDKLSGIQAKFPFSGTPTTLFVTKGKEKNTLNRIEGEASFSEIVEILKENKCIKE